jgi:hypothetical protein
MQDPFRRRGTTSTVLTAIVNIFWMVGAASAMMVPAVGLMWTRPIAEAPALGGAPGSGIIVRTEVTAIWIPQALRDLVRLKSGPQVDSSSEELQTYLKRNGWSAAWYALTYRGHQVNGGFGEITHIRWLSAAADHLDELQDVMATAAGRPPRFEDGDFSHAQVEVIPDTLRGTDPREAITRLIAKPVVGENHSPTEGLHSTRSTE